MGHISFVPDARLSKLEEVRPQMCCCSKANEMVHDITGKSCYLNFEMKISLIWCLPCGIIETRLMQAREKMRGNWI